jgi:PAS domain S-box-containing protein
MDETIPGTTEEGAINYRSLIESLNHVVFTLDDKGRFVYLSPGCHAILGLTPADLQGKLITSVVIPDDKVRLCSKYKSVKGGESYPSDYQVIDTDGRIHHVRAISRAFTDEKGMPGVIGVISEIQNWRNAEEALRQSEEKVKRIVECSHDGVILIDESGTVIEWNPAIEVITGFSGSECIGRKVWDVQSDLSPDSKKTPEQAVSLKKLFLPLLSGGASDNLEHRLEHVFQRRDKTLRTIESYLFPVPTDKGFMIGGILRDITDRKKAEMALREVNRKLNLLSSITRHDINNQLTIFSGYLTLLETDTPAMKKEDILRILRGSTGKIQRILKFTREYQEVGVKSPAWQDLDLTIRLAKTTIDAGTVRFPPGDACTGLEIYADPMLVRVFSNLIDNSFRHGEKVSEIRIHGIAEEHRLVIVYEDNGVGISPSIRPVLFERGKGKNTGYGMFLIREILAITGLTIAETGEPGKGARFEIVVPEGSFRVTEKTMQQ